MHQHPWSLIKDVLGVKCVGGVGVVPYRVEGISDIVRVGGGGQGSQGCRVEGTGNGGVTNKDLGAVIFVLERRQKTAAFDDNGSLRRTGEDRGATESGDG